IQRSRASGSAAPSGGSCPGKAAMTLVCRTRDAWTSLASTSTDRSRSPTGACASTGTPLSAANASAGTRPHAATAFGLDPGDRLAGPGHGGCRGRADLGTGQELGGPDGDPRKGGRRGDRARGEARPPAAPEGRERDARVDARARAGRGVGEGGEAVLEAHR